MRGISQNRGSRSLGLWLAASVGRGSQRWSSAAVAAEAISRQTVSEPNCIRGCPAGVCAELLSGCVRIGCEPSALTAEGDHGST